MIHMFLAPLPLRRGVGERWILNRRNMTKEELLSLKKKGLRFCDLVK
jgi:hypothetical protein